MSYFLSSNRCQLTVWGSRDLFGGGTPGSRAAVFLNYLRLQYAATLSRYCCKIFSPQLFKISKMASKSAKSVFDFLRLVRSWLRIVAASGVNLPESVATGAGFLLIGRSA